MNNKPLWWEQETGLRTSVQPFGYVVDLKCEMQTFKDI